MDPLNALPNVGDVLRRNLRAIGVETPQQLAELGARGAFLKIRAEVDPGACLHMLYGLQGAIDGVRDNLLPQNTKDDLKTFFKSLDD